MLPSRLYRNLGIPPTLRSLITPHPSLPATTKVQLRFRLGVLSNPTNSATTPSGPRFHSTSSSTSPPSSSHDSDTTKSESESKSEEATSPTASASVTPQELPQKIEPMLSMTFTCTVTDCNTRSTHQFSKRSYERGIVLIQCPGCENRHLIADHLGWFKESTEDGKLRTVEDLLRARGETIRRGRIGSDGVVEYVE